MIISSFRVYWEAIFWNSGRIFGFIAATIFSFFFTVREVPAQSPKKSFEYASTAEQQGDLEQALAWYIHGLKGGESNREFAYQNYTRLVPKIIQSKLDSVSAAGEIADKTHRFESCLSFIREQRRLWTDEASKRQIKPDWTSFNTILASLFEPALIRGQQQSSYDQMSSNLDQINLTVQTYREFFDYPDERNKIMLTSDTYKSYLNRLKQSGCRDTDDQITKTQNLYAARDYRAAYKLARETMMIRKENHCDTESLSALIAGILKDGGTSIAIFPFKDQDDVGAVNTSIISSLKELGDPFLSPVDADKLQTALLQQGLTVEDTYAGDAVSFTNLGKLIGISCIVTGKIIQATAGNGNVTSSSFSAYLIEHDNKGVYALKQVTGTEYRGHRVSSYKAQVTVIDLRSSAILYSDMIDYSYADDIHAISAPAEASGLSNISFSKYIDTSNESAVAGLIDSFISNAVPGPVKDWQRKIAPLMNGRTEFTSNGVMTREFAQKITQKITSVISQKYGAD